MGMINGRNVFSRTSSSATSHRANGSRSNEKKRWTVVRSYLCGDEEFDSVLAEEDSASVKSSEATFSSNQPYASSNGEMIEHTVVLSRQEEAVLAESLRVRNAATNRKKPKPGRNISRRKTVPSHHQCPKEPMVTNSPVRSRTIMHKKDRKLQRSDSNREIKCIDASSTS